MLSQRLVDQYRHLPKRTRTVLLTCLYGVGAGSAAVAFQLAMNLVYQRGLVVLSHQSFTVFLLGSLSVITVASLLVGWLLSSFCPEAAGSGIPQLKAAFWKDFGYVPWNVVWVKFVAGIVSIGGGCSLGREGPAVQLAGALASNLGVWPASRSKTAGSARRQALLQDLLRRSTRRWPPSHSFLKKSSAT